MVNIGIAGATGMVGRTFLKVMKERKFPVDQLHLFASSRSKGSTVEFDGKKYVVEELNENSFDKQMDIILFSAGGQLSQKYAPIAQKKGIIVVDNSSAWRMEDWVPLVVPEVNGDIVSQNKGIISNPNCSTIQAVIPLKPLNDVYKVKRVIFSTYQAVSGSGVAGLEDLEKGLTSTYNNIYPHPIAYNVLPHIDSFLDNGYTKEEMKMIDETKKILDDQDIQITATTVRVPVRYGHAISANIELEKNFELNDILTLFENTDGIEVLDNPNDNIYPMPILAEGKDQVYVGRIRRDYSIKNGLNLWIVADNSRKGAATNTVQIAELLLNK